MKWEREIWEYNYENEWVNSIHIVLDNSDQEVNCNMLMNSVKKEIKQDLLLEKFEQKYIEVFSRTIDGEVCPSIYNNYLSKKNEL